MKECAIKKYAITAISRDVTVCGEAKTVHRIIALKDFTVEAWNGRKVFAKEIHVGDLGGYVESEDNLSQDGNCWVDDKATVCGDALVSENAYVGGRAWVVDNARVYGNAKVSIGSRLFGHSEVSGDAWVYGFTLLKGNVKLTDNAHVCSTTIDGDVTVCDNAYIDNFRPAISGSRIIGENARLVSKSLIEFGFAEPPIVAD